MLNRSSNNIIIKSLIVAILNNKPQIFLYYLLSINVEITFPNKLRFYEFFTKMLKSAYRRSKGRLYLKIENPEWEEDGYTHYCFYDKYHKYSRIDVFIKEANSKINFEMYPF